MKWLAAVLLAGCGVVAAPDDIQTDDPVEQPAPEIEACALMDCDLLIGESCPVCGKPELTCACYRLNGDGSDEIGTPCEPPAGSLTCI